MLNHFAMEAGIAMLSDPMMKDFVRDHVELVVTQRDLLAKQLQEFKDLEVFESKANFLLLRWNDQESCEKAYQYLISKGILLRNVSKGPQLRLYLDSVLGQIDENKAFINALRSYYTG